MEDGIRPKTLTSRANKIQSYSSSQSCCYDSARPATSARRVICYYPAMKWLLLIFSIVKSSLHIVVAVSLFVVGVLQAHPAAADNGLRLISRNDHLDSLAREPMIVRHESGALFVAGYASQITGTDWTAPPLLWRSDDDGESWDRVDVGTTSDGAQGNSDVDLAAGPDGTLYFLSMGFNRETREGTHIAVGISRDVGATWQWQMLSTTRFDDRPWISIAPNGIVHVIWNDGSGVRHSVSENSGGSWSEQEPIHFAGGSSHMAIGPQGEIAVRISPISASANKYDAAVDLIATSSDNGVSWIKRPPPASLSWDRTLSGPQTVRRWVEPLAWGNEHDLWHLWSEGQVIKLGRSTDYGQSWQIHDVTHEKGIAFFPYMVAGPGGKLAATWFVKDGHNLSARTALIDISAETNSRLKVQTSDLFTISAWLENTETMTPTPAGEYIPVMFLADGTLAVVSPIQDGEHGRWGFTWWNFGEK